MTDQTDALVSAFEHWNCDDDGNCCIKISSLRYAAAHITTQAAQIAALTERVRVLGAEKADLEQSVIAFCGPWAVQYATNLGLGKDELHPCHYDILVKCGARMDSFTRAALASKEPT